MLTFQLIRSVILITMMDKTVKHLTSNSSKAERTKMAVGPSLMNSEQTSRSLKTGSVTSKSLLMMTATQTVKIMVRNPILARFKEAGPVAVSKVSTFQKSVVDLTTSCRSSNQSQP